MKEYNWRKEREKFRPDFQQEKQLQAEGISSEPVKKSSSKKGLIAAMILLAAVIAGGIFIFKDSTAQLADVAEEYKSAVGLVTLTIELKNGKKMTEAIGTAWAFSENRFATNAHVANDLRGTLQKAIVIFGKAFLDEEAKKRGCGSSEELLKKLTPEEAEALTEQCKKRFIEMIENVRADIIINGTKRKTYGVTHVQIHKDYGAVNTKVDPDIAVLTIDGKHDNYFELADKETLHNLKSGMSIAFLGFPMENLQENNVNIDNPVASMQSGIIVAVSDFDMKDAGGDGNFLLRHNLPATGGASGSPIFNKDGEVVALLFSGNVHVKFQNGELVERTANAAQINFGVRVDMMEGMGKKVPFDEFIKL